MELERRLPTPLSAERKIVRVKCCDFIGYRLSLFLSLSRNKVVVN